MSAAVDLQSKPIKKYVLQQSNCNIDLPQERVEDTKHLEKSILLVRSKDEMFETENLCSPQIKEDKLVKSEAKKLRSIRLDLSSLKRAVIIQKTSVSLKELSSNESSDEDNGSGNQKPRPVVPNYVTNVDSGPCRKPRQSKQEPLVLSSQNIPKSAKAQPLSIARRNARERNRVKQVNEGFATLRSRIPEYISDAYNEEKGRKSAKKLSKVETLRMALDYIRHLETLLDLKSTEKEAWIKTEDQPWDTPCSSVDYPSPVDSKYQPGCAGSPAPGYDQAFEYQDRIFYEYDLDFVSRKESLLLEKRPAVLGLLTIDSENQSVDDFKYYETFNKLKKKNGESGVVEEDEMEDKEEVLEGAEEAPDPQPLPKPKDVIKKVLPSITESFSKGIPVFF